MNNDNGNRLSRMELTTKKTEDTEFMKIVVIIFKILEGAAPTELSFVFYFLPCAYAHGY